MKPEPKSLGQVCRQGFYGQRHDYEDFCGKWWSRAARAVVREWERRQWRPVSTPPKKPGWILVRYDDHGMIYTRNYMHKFDSNCSHWRPLPKGPR